MFIKVLSHYQNKEFIINKDLIKSVKEKTDSRDYIYCLITFTDNTNFAAKYSLDDLLEILKN